MSTPAVEISKEGFFNIINQIAPHQVVFDIETAARDDLWLRKFYKQPKKLPKELKSPPGDFNPLAVKTGNIKDPVKKNAKIAQSRKQHAANQIEYTKKLNEFYEESFNTFRDKAALKAHLNRVLAIGYGVYTGKSLRVWCDYGNELSLIKNFWRVVSRIRHEACSGNLYSWNGHNFDIPIMVQKSWMVGTMPHRLITKYGKMEDFLIDGEVKWRQGVWGMDAKLKLEHAAIALGVEGKLSGMDGSQFAEVLQTNPEKAREYLRRDISATFYVLERMGCFTKHKSYLTKVISDDDATVAK